MSIETVLSIVESASGEVVARVGSVSAAEYTAFMTPRWIERLRYLNRWGMHSYIKQLAGSFIGKNAAFQNAMAHLAAEEAAVSAAARTAAANAAATAAEGTLVAGTGTTVAAVTLPVVAMVAVQLALGAPYYEAREEAKKKEYLSGFSKGFITGLLNWELRFAIDRFWDNAVLKDVWDEMMPTIRANAHNKGLLEGRVAGLAKDDRQKKTYVEGLRKLTVTSRANWLPRSDDWMERMRARNVQIHYVIDLAAAARKHGLITEE